MAAFPFVSYLLARRYWLGGVAVALATLCMGVGNAVAQLRDPASQTPPPQQSEELNELRPLNQASNALSIVAGEQLMAEASQAIENQNYNLAADNLKTARETFNQLSNYYSELAGFFLGVNSEINQSHRQKALQTAQLRDQASYQLALVYRAQNRADLAVPLLMEILRSQQPTRDLGQQAYQQLFELGFVDQPYTGSNSSRSSNP